MADRAALRRAGWIALAVAVVLCFAGIFQHGLWTPDEPREAEVGREMLVSHFSAMPTLGGEPFLEKPPLYAWITAASYAVFHVNAGAARLPAALFSVGAILVAYLLGKRAAGRLAGLCSAIALATMWQFSETSHKAVLDTALTFFVAAGHLAFLHLWKTVVRSQTPYHRVAPYVAIGACSGLAFLTKAWIGPALLCAPPILAAAAMRDWEYVKRVLPRAFVAAMLGVAAFGIPWMLALAHTPGGGWAAVKSCLVDEYVGRAVGGAALGKRGHANPPWYYTYTALYVVAPWVLALPAMLKGSTLLRSWRGGRTLWLGLVFVAGLVLLSVPSGKRDLYLVPLLPVAAVPVGVWLSRVGSRRGGVWDVATVRTLSILAGLLTALILAVCLYVMTATSYPSAVPDSVRAVLTAERKNYGFVVFVSLSISLWAGILGFRRRAKSWPRAARLASGLVVLYVVVHCGAFPRLDAFRDMEGGSKEIAALVPADEPLLAFSADETTLAVVPFHTERLVANAEKPIDAIHALDAGRSKHLLVMDKDVKTMGAALTSRLELVKIVRLSATRDVNVYKLKP